MIGQGSAPFVPVPNTSGVGRQSSGYRLHLSGDGVGAEAMFGAQFQYGF